MPVSSKTLNGYLALFRQTTSAVPIRVTHAARVRYLRDPWQQSVTGRYPPGAGSREENKPMTTGRLSRRLRVDGEPRPGRARNVPAPGRMPVTEGPRRQPSARRWVSLAWSAVLPVCDGCALAAAVLLVAPGWPAVGYAVAALLVLNVSGRHRLRICLRLSDEVSRLAVAAIIPLPLLLPWTEAAGGVTRLVVMSAGLLVTMRAGLYAALRAARRSDWLTEPVLIVGMGKLGVEVGELLLEHSDLGLRPVGFIGSLPPDPESPLPLLGELSEMSDVVSRHGVRRVIVCFPADSDADLVSTLRATWRLRAEVYVVPRMYELAAAIPPACLDEVCGIPLVPLRRSGLRRSGRVVKRVFDLVAGTALLLALTPVLLVLMIAVLLSCGRPVLFWQVRVTRDGRLMKIAKLRTVASQHPGAQWTVPPDQCSSLGRWLRATHLDELPQLINVIRGEMSLVGPRPERPYFASQFAEVIPRYEDRHRAHAGMTGWAQVHGLTGDTSISERVRFDNRYIENWSLWLDIVILARTIAQPLTGVRKTHRSRERT